jgi:hypothetical protein
VAEIIGSKKELDEAQNYWGLFGPCPSSGGFFFSAYQTLDKTQQLGNPEGEKKTPWSESVSELYRPSDRRMSAK